MTPKPPAAMALEALDRTFKSAEEVEDSNAMIAFCFALHKDTIRQALAQMQDAQGVERVTVDELLKMLPPEWGKLDALQFLAQKYSGKRIEICKEDV